MHGGGEGACLSFPEPRPAESTGPGGGTASLGPGGRGAAVTGRRWGVGKRAGHWGQWVPGSGQHKVALGKDLSCCVAIR